MFIDSLYGIIEIIIQLMTIFELEIFEKDLVEDAADVAGLKKAPSAPSLPVSHM